MHRSEWNFLFLIAGAALLAVVAWLALRRPEERQPVERLAANWTLEPRWERPLPAVDLAAGTGGELAIYLDSSLPIGGYLPPQWHSEQSALESLLRLVPQSLADIDRSPSSRLRWHGLSAAPARLAAAPASERRFFTGGESRLDLAVAEIERDFEAGRLEAALVITDLVTTGEVVGAQGTAQSLRDWISSAEVLAGAVDFGLLAIKAPYWGIRTTTCRAPGANAACYFSEQRQEWLTLPVDAKLPLYVLVFTRGRNAAGRILEGLAAELSKRQFEVQAELFTADSAGEPRLNACTVHSAAEPQRQQYALFGKEGGRLTCERNEVIQLRCPLPEPLGRVKEVATTGGEVLPFSMSDERVVQLELDCARRRDREFTLDLQLGVEAAQTGGPSWASWSSATDDRPEDLGKTLRLQEFVEKVRVRPPSYLATIRLLPEGASHGR